MADQFSLVYQAPPVALLAPAADAAGRTSSYRSLKNAHKAYVVCHINQGNAATVALTLLQGQDVTGTGSKVLTSNVPIWFQSNTATTDLNVSQTAAANFTTDAGTNDKIVIFEILPETALDVANGFKTIAVQTGASNAANITEALLIVAERYQGQSQLSTYS
jgi:hypothetical protein